MSLLLSTPAIRGGCTQPSIHPYFMQSLLDAQCIAHALTHIEYRIEYACSMLDVPFVHTYIQFGVISFINILRRIHRSPVNVHVNIKTSVLFSDNTQWIWYMRDCIAFGVGATERSPRSLTYLRKTFMQQQHKAPAGGSVRWLYGRMSCMCGVDCNCVAIRKGHLVAVTYREVRLTCCNPKSVMVGWNGWARWVLWMRMHNTLRHLASASDRSQTLTCGQSRKGKNNNAMNA